MIKKRKKVYKQRLQPRSFLARPELDDAISRAAREAGMTRSQWIRKALQQQLEFEHVAVRDSKA